MKKLKFVSNRRILKTNKNTWLKGLLIKTPIIIGVFMLLFACENDIEQVREISAKHDSATISAKMIEISYSAHGLQKVLMTAPKLERYAKGKKDVTLIFPDGMQIIFYDSVGNQASMLRAKYSIYYESDGIWEATNDVVAQNEKGEQLNTEFLVWNQKDHTISSDQLVKMSTEDGIIYGDGFISDQQFSSWEIQNSRGVININMDE